MKIVLFTLLLFICPNLYAVEQIYNQTAISYSSERNESCEKAFLKTKKDALDYAGVLLESSLHLYTGERNNVVTKSASVDVRQIARGVVKLIDKTETVKKNEKGMYICKVTARLSIDSDSSKIQNKKYNGQLPSWVVQPIRVLNKVTVIGSASTQEGAILSAIFKYNMIYAGKVSIDKIFNELSDRKYKASSSGVSGRITDNIELTGLLKYEIDKNNEFIQSELARLKFVDPLKKQNRIIDMKRMRTDTTEFEDNESFRFKGDASIDSLITELQRSGFNVEYEEVVLNENNRWYVMLIANKLLDRLSNMSKNGKAWAMSDLGGRYLYGLGVIKNYNQAIQLLTAASQKGDKNSMNELGHIYLNGWGVKQNKEKAIYWYLKSDPESTFAKYLSKE